MQTWKKAKNVKADKQVLIEVVDGMGGVMKGIWRLVWWKQVGVENVVSLVPSDIIEKEQVEADEDIGETSTRDFDQIEMDLEKTILMVEEQENVVIIIPLLEQENSNEYGEPHAHIDGGGITIELRLL